MAGATNTIIQILRSNTTAYPTTLEPGEQAYSYVSQKLFVGNTDTTVITIGGKYYVDLIDNATASNTIMFLSGNGEYDGAGNWVTIPNDAKGQPGCNGDIGIRTRGMVANTSYTIIAEFRKHNEYYQRGQLTDPGSFNYGAYGVRP